MINLEDIYQSSFSYCKVKSLDTTDKFVVDIDMSKTKILFIFLFTIFLNSKQQIFCLECRCINKISFLLDPESEEIQSIGLYNYRVVPINVQLNFYHVKSMCNYRIYYNHQNHLFFVCMVVLLGSFPNVRFM